MTQSRKTTATRSTRAAAPESAAVPEEADLSAAVSMWHAFLLRKATQRVTAMAEAALGPRGVSMRHFGVLSSAEADPGLSQRDVGERLRIDRTTVVALSDDLENAGLIERRRGVDRRTFALHLTRKGTAELKVLKGLVAEVHDEFLAPLTAAERAMLHDLLFKLANG